MRCKILDSSLAEFSRQGYGASYINAICSAQNLSKGSIYHYFETKDELYLVCVEECFALLTDYLRAHFPCENLPIEEQLKQYFALRSAFSRHIASISASFVKQWFARRSIRIPKSKDTGRILIC